MHTEPLQRDKERNFLLIVLSCVSLVGLVSPAIGLALGIFFALLVGNPRPELTQQASRVLLQWSVAALGFGLNLTAVWQAGTAGFWFTVVSIIGTLIVGSILGRLLNVDRDTSLLVCAGTSICGGSAIAATSAVIRANSRAVSVSLATVFVLNAVALFIFPPIGHYFELTQMQFGVWAAIAIHDTSSVVGAASKFGDAALQIATTVKLTRALWIIPLVLGVAAFRKNGEAKIKIPWFIAAFLLAASMRSVWPEYSTIYEGIKEVAKHALTLTLFLIGCGLSRDALRVVGIRPLLQGFILWVLVSGCTLLSVLFLI